ncbi:MAG TPA: hypothetical protein VM266_13750 [Solirubrobacteraceae bacterium]|nr:hypothetical protein [Solirubrobacteraceae bacterium]
MTPTTHDGPGLGGEPHAYLEAVDTAMLAGAGVAAAGAVAAFALIGPARRRAAEVAPGALAVVAA